MKKLLVSLVVLAIFSATGYSTQRVLPLNKGLTQTSVSGAVATSQVDTVIFSNEGNLQGATFAAFYSDSVNITSCVVRRVVNGVVQTVAIGDTLNAFSSFAKNGSGNPTSSVAQAFVVASAANPNAVQAAGSADLRGAAEQYYFIITYAGSAIGTSTVATYKVLKTLSAK